LKMQGANVTSARVVLGYIAPMPWPSPEAERAISGQPINKSTAQKAADAALAKATPLSHNAYKVRLAKVALTRAILKAAGGAA
jgi:xanthine dehydrogenase YagS FAD-binding subunit